ncbi:MAG: hypothetical protein H7Z12_18545 [Rhodospirillaceae bacterium]|nr:hypothetical protein [Rhodospirillales bacterium]
MKRTIRNITLVFVCVMPLLACEDKGPAEKAGMAVDQAAQEVKDIISPPGPLEKAGRSIDNALK